MIDKRAAVLQHLRDGFALIMRVDDYGLQEDVELVRARPGYAPAVKRVSTKLFKQMYAAGDIEFKSATPKRITYVLPEVK